MLFPSIETVGKLSDSSLTSDEGFSGKGNCTTNEFPINPDRYELAMSDLLSNKRRQYKVGNGLNFSPRQRCRMRIRWHVFAKLASRQAITVVAFVCIFIEVRHFRARSATCDHFDQLQAIKLRFMQVRRPARRSRIPAPISVRSVAELAICLVMIETLTERHILSLSHRH